MGGSSGMARGTPVLLAAGFETSSLGASLPGVGKCDDAGLDASAGIRHSRHYGRAACLAGATAASLRRRSAQPAERTGLLCNGGPWNLNSSWDFLSRAREAGPGYINPIRFPPTLVSATPTAVAASIGAHAFSYVVGHDCFAFFDVLERAMQALRHGYANRVFALAISASDHAIGLASKMASLNEPLDVGLGFGLGANGSEGDLSLVDVVNDEDSLDLYPAAVRYDALLTAGSLSFPLWLPLVGGEAYGATAAVLIVAAAMHHGRLPDESTQRECAVTFRDPTRFAAAVLRINGRPCFR